MKLKKEKMHLVIFVFIFNYHLSGKEFVFYSGEPRHNHFSWFAIVQLFMHIKKWQDNQFEPAVDSYIRSYEGKDILALILEKAF